LVVVAAKPKRRLRAHRARARRRPRTNGVDLRSRYEPDVPASAGLSVVELDDPYGQAGRVDAAGNLDASMRTPVLLSAKIAASCFGV
jgi:hypothetical protein